MLSAMNAEQLALEPFEYKVSDTLARKRFEAANASLGRVGMVLTDPQRVVRSLDQLEPQRFR